MIKIYKPASNSNLYNFKTKSYLHFSLQRNIYFRLKRFNKKVLLKKIFYAYYAPKVKTEVFYSLRNYYLELLNKKLENKKGLLHKLESNYFRLLYNLPRGKDITRNLEISFYLDSCLTKLVRRLKLLKRRSIFSYYHLKKTLRKQYKIRNLRNTVLKKNKKPNKIYKKTIVKTKIRKRPYIKHIPNYRKKTTKPKLFKSKASILPFFNKFAAVITKNGLKRKAYNLLISSFTEFKKKYKANRYSNIDLMYYISRKVNPRFYLRRFHLGRRLILIPFGVRDEKKLVHQTKLLKKALSLRPELGFRSKLTTEISDLLLNKGYSKKLMLSLRRSIYKNRPNIRFLRVLNRRKKKSR